MSRLVRLSPKSMAAQMIAVLAVSLVLILAIFTLLEALRYANAIELAARDSTLARLKRMKPAMENIDAQYRDYFLAATSSCHEGYSVTQTPIVALAASTATSQLQQRFANALALRQEQVIVGHASLTRNDFSYDECGDSIDFPMDAVVISIRLHSGHWFHTEVHHEWHLAYMINWITRTSAVFIFIGGFAIFFMARLGKPLSNLTNAAQQFGMGLEISRVEESGPQDLRRAIQAFNAMQQQVSDEIAKRTRTLAAISHDVRTPLTALRVKAELIDDPNIRADLISSIEKMEKITTAALQFLKGESRTEPMRVVNLSSLLESECSDFAEMAQPVTFFGEQEIRLKCRPDALARAVRNLIENAVRYGNSAEVSVQTREAFIDIVVGDCGPGIPDDKIEQAVEPFSRLSRARESSQGGFGLGLAIVRAIAEGHDGELALTANTPTGLVATIRLPKR